MPQLAQPRWIATTPYLEYVAILGAAFAATKGTDFWHDLPSDEQRAALLIGAGLLLGGVMYGMRSMCGSERTSLCVLAG